MDEVVKEYTFYMLHHIDNNPDGIYDDSLLQYYIGSTTRLYDRVRQHRSTYNNPDDLGYNLKLYKHIRSTGGFDEWECSILEKLYLTKKEAHIHERMLIELYSSELNMVLPSRSESERKESNKEKLIAYSIAYNTSHKEERNAKAQVYRLSHREEINEKQRAKRAAKKASVPK